MAPRFRRARRVAPVIAMTIALTAAGVVCAQERGATPPAQTPPVETAQTPFPVPAPTASQLPDNSDGKLTTIQEVRRSLVRLPLAAGLGALLALRPRRRGTPPRSVAVVQTQ